MARWGRCVLTLAFDWVLVRLVTVGSVETFVEHARHGRWVTRLCIRLRRLPSKGQNEGSSGYEKTRKSFFNKFREVANKKQSDPDENVSSVEQVC